MLRIKAIIIHLFCCSLLIFTPLVPASLQNEDGALFSIEPINPKADTSLLAHPSLSQSDFFDRVQFSLIHYLSDGMVIGGCLIEPKDPGNYPAIIYNHGGHKNFGALGFDLNMLWLADIASRGYVVMASQYRGVADNPGNDEFGGADVNDVLSLIPLLESRANVDASRIGMLGESRGGMMTYLALSRTSKIKAAVVIAGIADLLTTANRRPEMAELFEELIGGNSFELQKQLVARSAVYWVDRLPKTTPILLIHGTADWRVHPNQSIQMASLLLEAKTPFSLMLFEGADHGLTEFPRQLRRHVHLWFHRYLQAYTPSPILDLHGR